jgi:hypothetical protein
MPDTQEFDTWIDNQTANEIAGISDSSRRRAEKKGQLPMPQRLGSKPIRKLRDFLAALERLPSAADTPHACMAPISRPTRQARPAQARCTPAGS